MGVYQIVAWDRHYENSRSRDVDQCSFVCVPNKQHGMGFKYIMAEPDGPSIYGIWNLILGLCSQQRLHYDPNKPPDANGKKVILFPRDGWLTVNGLADGAPLNAKDLAIKWTRHPDEIQRALDVLCSDNIMWLRHLETTVVKLPSSCRQATLNGRNEEKRRKEGKKEIPAAVAAEASEHKSFVSLFVSLWQASHPRAKYQFQAAKDASAVGRIRKAVSNDLPTFKRIVSAFLADSDRFLVSNGHTLAIMSTRLNALLAADAKNNGDPDGKSGSYRMPSKAFDDRPAPAGAGKAG